MRTKHHRLGEGLTVGYNFEASTWNKVREEINHKETEAHLDSILEANPVNPISFINEKFIESCDQTLKNLEQLFDTVYADELEKKKDLKDEYDEIEKWFEERGLYSISPL
jgi:hypothetical protein